MSLYLGTNLVSGAVQDAASKSGTNTFTGTNTFNTTITGTTNGNIKTDHSNDTKPYIVETYVSGYTWYRIWSNNWVEQGGRITPSSTTSTVNLSVQMSNTNYSALISMDGPSPNGAQYSVWWVYSRAVKTFNIYMAGGSSTYSFFWEVNGYKS